MIETILKLIPKPIRDTNGDILGVLLFVALIVYFSLNLHSNWEIAFLVSCILALIVDLGIVLTHFRRKPSA